MLSVFLIFLFSFLSSFIGSLQLGPVNLFVINTALFEGKTAAYWVAIGGSLPEFIYCTLAVSANSWISNQDWLLKSIRIAFILLLFLLAIVFFLRKHSKISFDKEPVQTNKPSKYFLKGFSLAVLNPQLLPFWLFILVYFNSTDFLQVQSIFHKTAFILGSGIGAFFLQTSFLLIVSSYKQIFLRFINNKYYFKLLSLLLIVIAGHQLWLLTNQ